MPTIQQIEDALVAYAQVGDLVNFTNTVNSVLSTQKPLLDPNILGQALDLVASNLTQPASALAAAASNFMVQLGAYTSVPDIGLAVDYFAHSSNYGGVTGIVDNITATQKTLLDPNLLGDALNAIANSDLLNAKSAAATALDFMTKVGAYTSVPSIALAADTFAHDGDLTGVKNIVDNITATQKTLLDPNMLGDVLTTIANGDLINQAGTAAEVQDFMTHVGAYTSVPSIALAADTLAHDGDLTGVKNVVDNITATQKTLLDPNMLGDTLNAIVQADLINQKGVDAELTDFMSHVGAYTSVPSIALAADTLAHDGDLAGVKNVVDYITATQKTLLDPNMLGDALNAIVQADFINTTGVDAELTDFMSHVGAYTSVPSIALAVDTLAHDGDLTGVKNVVDYITATQKTLLDPNMLGDALNAIVQDDFINAAGVDAELTDFMSHVGANTSAAAVSQALDALAHDGDLTGVKNVVDNVAATQKALLDPNMLGDALNAIVMADFINPTGVDTELTDFMSHIGAYTSVASIGFAVDTLAHDGDLAGVKNVIDYITATQKTTLDPNMLGDALNAIVMSDFINPTGVDAEVTDFMTHVGANTSASAVGYALDTLAHDGDLTGVKNIADNIAATQKTALDPNTLGDALNAIVMADFINQAGVDAAVTDFMTHVGANTSAAAIGQALDTLAHDGDLAGVRNLVDNIATAQKTALDPNVLGDALNAIVMDDFINPAGVDAEVTDFMTHIGANTSAAAVGQALDTLAHDGDLDGVRALADNIAAQQKAKLDPNVLTDALHALSYEDFVNPSGTAYTEGDFIAKLGTYIPGAAIENAVITEGYDGNWQGAADILGHLTTTQDSALSSSFHSWMSANGVQLTATASATLNASATANCTLVAQGTSETLNGNAGNDTLYGSGHYDVLKGGDGNDLLIGHGTDTLTGGNGADRFAIDGGGQVNVTDFNTAQGDVLDLRDVLEPTATVTANVSNYLLLVNTTTGTLVYVDQDGKGTASGFVDVGFLQNVHTTDYTTLIANHNLLV